MMLNFFLLKYGGTSAVAAFAIVMYVDSIIGMLNFGLCDSLQPALSYCHGAGEKARLKAIFRRILWASFVMAVAAFFFMELAGPYMAELFSQNEGGELMPPIASLFSGILALFLYRNSQSDLTRKLLISHS